MVYGIYREEEVRMLSHGEIVVGDDGKTKRIVYRRHFMKYDYIPMEQVACIESGDGVLRIELKDGNEKYGWQYAKFGNVPTSLSEREDCYNELPMELHRFGYYYVDDFVYVDDKTAERMKYNARASYVNDGEPKDIVGIINQVQALYNVRIRMMTKMSYSYDVKNVAFEIQNYIFRQLYNATYGQYALDNGVQVMFDTDNNTANCIISDEAFKILADNNIL